MFVLGIETSCDETSVSVVEDGRTVRSCAIASSLADFTTLGGVIPEYAARRQVEWMIPTVEKALKDANATWKDIGLIAVTSGPGLLGSLLVGTMTARILAHSYAIPLIHVHHTLGHLFSSWLDDSLHASEPQFPLLTLSVSGGHSDIWHRTGLLAGSLIGSTRDDAAGEAFDKGASMLGLPYPGGPALAKLAEAGDANAFSFPHPLSQEDTLDFSFSGLKTSLKYLLRDLCKEKQCTLEELPKKTIASIAASYERALCQHLIDRLQKAAERHLVKEIHIVGGVSANKTLRSMLTTAFEEKNITIRFPSKNVYSTDNAAMIASAGYYLYKENPKLANTEFKTEANVPLSLSM